MFFFSLAIHTDIILIFLVCLDTLSIFGSFSAEKCLVILSGQKEDGETCIDQKVN